MKKLLMFLGTILSIVVIFAASAFGGYLYITPASYISLNSDPSFRYAVNAYGRVLNVESSCESNELINELDMNNMKISEAIQETVDKLISINSISQYKNTRIIVSVSNTERGKAERLEEKLRVDIKKYLERKVDIKYLEIETEIKQ